MLQRIIHWFISRRKLGILLLLSFLFAYLVGYAGLQIERAPSLLLLENPISKDLSDRMLKSFTMKPSFKGTTLDSRLVSTWAMIPAVLFPNRLARVSELSHIYFERGLSTSLIGPPIQARKVNANSTRTHSEILRLRNQVAALNNSLLLRSTVVSYDFPMPTKNNTRKCVDLTPPPLDHADLSVLKAALQTVTDSFSLAHVPLIIWGESYRQFVLHCNSFLESMQQLEFLFPYDHIVSRAHLDLLFEALHVHGVSGPSMMVGHFMQFGGEAMFWYQEHIDMPRINIFIKSGTIDGVYMVAPENSIVQYWCIYPLEGFNYVEFLGIKLLAPSNQQTSLRPRFVTHSSENFKFSGLGWCFNHRQLLEYNGTVAFGLHLSYHGFCTAHTRGECLVSSARERQLDQIVTWFMNTLVSRVSRPCVPACNFLRSMLSGSQSYPFNVSFAIEEQWKHYWVKEAIKAVKSSTTFDIREQRFKSGFSICFSRLSSTCVYVLTAPDRWFDSRSGFTFGERFLFPVPLIKKYEKLFFTLCSGTEGCGNRIHQDIRRNSVLRNSKSQSCMAVQNSKLTFTACDFEWISLRSIVKRTMTLWRWDFGFTTQQSD